MGSAVKGLIFCYLFMFALNLKVLPSFVVCAALDLHTHVHSLRTPHNTRAFSLSIAVCCLGKLWCSRFDVADWRCGCGTEHHFNGGMHHFQRLSVLHNHPLHCQVEVSSETRFFAFLQVTAGVIVLICNIVLIPDQHHVHCTKYKMGLKVEIILLACHCNQRFI